MASMAIAARLQVRAPHGQQWPASGLRAGTMIGFLPLGGPDGGNSVALVWSVPARAGRQ
jgi:hypothetical protein